ncbi:MAG: hypothetical protein ACE5GO_12755, partial [Anaerolineales bacterium]
MSTFLRVPHNLIRRNLSRIERAFAVAGLTGLVYALLSGLPVYPPFWDVVILAAVFLSGLYAPGIGYLIALAAAAFPLFTVSEYLAALFLAVGILGYRAFVQNLGAAVLVLAAPFLSGYSLVWIVPLLGGLWWGASGGAWTGGLAALWGMLAAGMAGLNPDWLVLLGDTPSLRLRSGQAMSAVVERFAAADSLETLILLLEPLTSDTTVLLYHVLQIGAWAFMGSLVGKLADRKSVQDRHPWGTALIAILAPFVLLAAHVGLAFWLGQQSAETLPPWDTLLVAAAAVGVSAAALEFLHDFFEHPLPRLRFRERKRPSSAYPNDADASPGPAHIPSR